jgi:uncharacterized protein (TIGR00297 family)
MATLPYVIIGIFALSSFFLGKLTLTATLTAAIVAILIFLGAGYAGLEMLGAFFVLGVVATSFRKRDKEAYKPVSDHGNRRDACQVLANGGIAAICGLLAYLFVSYKQVLCLMMAGSLAAATSDTLSSELGMVYGRRFFNILNFKPDEKGLDGVVSVEGTIAGITGAAIIALIYGLCFGFSANFLFIVIAGAIGNYTDSLLGATLERQHIFNNNLVNFSNTLAGALVALVFTLI